MKIAIMSDSHDRWDHLEKAINIANNSGCDTLLFAGDLIAPPGVSILEKFNGKVKFVWGNNEGEKVGIAKKMDASKKIEICEDTFEGEIDGIKIFMNHYPRFVELAAKSGEFDLCVFGHTHDYMEEKIGNCLLINPGEIQGYKTGNITFVIYDTSTKRHEKIKVI